MSSLNTINDFLQCSYLTDYLYYNFHSNGKGKVATVLK
jgi:hypothetical protein